MNLGDIGSWLQKTFTPQQTKQPVRQVQPSFMDRVVQTIGGANNQMGKFYNNFAITPQKVQQADRFITNKVIAPVSRTMENVAFKNPIANTPVTSAIPFIGQQTTNALNMLKVKPITFGQVANTFNPIKIYDEKTKTAFPNSIVHKSKGMDELMMKAIKGDKVAMKEYQTRVNQNASDTAVAMSLGAPSKKVTSIRIHPEDKAVMAEFSRTVDEFGPKQNLGQLGVNAQRLVDHYFGKNWEHLSNTKIKQLFDYALAKREGGLVVKPKGVEIPAGLGTKEVEGIAQQALKAEQPYPWSVWNEKLSKWIDPSVPDEAIYGSKEFGLPSTKTNLPQFTKENIKNLISEAKLKSQTNKKEFGDVFSKWIGKRDAAKTIGVETASKLQVPKNIDGAEVIKFIESPSTPVSPQTKQYASKITKQFDILLKEANDAGIEIPKRENYISHIWNKPQEEVAQLYQQAKTKFGFAGERTLPTYEEGIKLGLTPKYTNPSQIVSEYVRKLEQTKANIEFIKGLRDKGFIVPKQTAGFVPITAPGFSGSSIRLGEGTVREGVYYAPPKIAELINNVFADQKNMFSGTAKASGKLQDITMSGGIPGTPVNAWTSAQVIKEVTAGRVKGPVKALVTSLNPEGTNKYLMDNVQFIKEQQLNNVPVHSTLNTENLAPKSAIEKVFGKNIGETWSKMVNEPTFKRFMPVLQTEFYKDIRSSAINAGKTEQEAIKIAATATKNFYGLTSTGDTAMKNKGVQDFLSTVLFAPRYRESMINFWLKSLKGLANPLALENRTNTKFLVGAATTLIAMDQANRYFNDGKSMSENPPNMVDKLLIPMSKITGDQNDKTVIGIPFLSSIATMPRALFREGKMVIEGDISGAAKDVGQTYSSMLIKPGTDVIANQDYFGKPITQEDMTPAEKFKAQGTYLFKQYVMGHPYIKELTSKANQGDPAYQRLSRAMELPIRYYDKAGINTAYYYGAKDNATKGMNDTEKNAFSSIPKADSNDPNTRILKYQIYLTYPKVFEAKQKIELETAARTGKAIDPLYLVNYDTAQKYMRYEALPEGSSDRKEMTKAYPELLALFDTRSKFFQNNPIPGQTQTTQKPIASAYVQSQMDAKNWKDPEVKAYLDSNTAWNNEQRAKLGLPPIAGFSTWPKKPKKIAFKKIKIPKITNIKVKTFKPKKIKMPKMPKLLTSKKKRSTIKIKA